MGRVSTLPKRLQPMLATLTDGPFDDPGWIFEEKYDGFRMVAKIEKGKVTLYSRNGQVISRNYIEVAQALEGVKGDAVIDGELVALDENGVSHFQLLQNALRRQAKLLYCAFDLMFQDGEDLRAMPLTERKKRLKAILPKHRLVAVSRHRKTFGTKFFEEAGRKGLEGIMAKRASSKYLSGARTDDGLKIKTRSARKSLSQALRLLRKRVPFSEPSSSRSAAVTAGAISGMSALASATPRLRSFMASSSRVAAPRPCSWHEQAREGDPLIAAG